MSIQKCSHWQEPTPETTPSYRYSCRQEFGYQSWRICELRISILSRHQSPSGGKGSRSGRLLLRKRASMPSKAIWRSEVRVSHPESFSTTRENQSQSGGFENSS